MGKTNKQYSTFKKSRDFKESEKLKNRQIDKQINREAYNSLENRDEDDYDDYSEDLNFEKFSRNRGKR